MSALSFRRDFSAGGQPVAFVECVSIYMSPALWNTKGRWNATSPEQGPTPPESPSSYRTVCAVPTWGQIWAIYLIYITSEDTARSPRSSWVEGGKLYSSLWPKYCIPPTLSLTLGYLEARLILKLFTPWPMLLLQACQAGQVLPTCEDRDYSPPPSTPSIHPSITPRGSSLCLPSSCPTPGIHRVGCLDGETGGSPLQSCYPILLFLTH